MCFVVVDPQLLVRAYEYPRSAPAQLLSLFMYGRTCAAAHGLRIDELEGIDGSRSLRESERESLRAWAQRARDVAARRKQLLEAVFEQHPPDDLLLITSAPLRGELIELARQAQGAGRWHVRPDKVNLQITRWTIQEVSMVGATPPYLGPNSPYRREYLVHTAILGQAESLVTEDERLLLDGDAVHRDPATSRSVRPSSLHDFVQDRVSSNFNFDDIDAPAVFRAASRYLGPE